MDEDDIRWRGELELKEKHLMQSYGFSEGKDYRSNYVEIELDRKPF